MAESPHLFTPRPYQKQSLDNAVERYNSGVNRQLIRMATGLGKTSGVAMHIPQRFAHLTDRYGLLFVAHRREILLDTYEKFRKAYPYKSVGLEMGEHKCIGYEDYIFASVDSIGRVMSSRLHDRYHSRYFGVIVTDEGHHVTPNSTWDNALTYFGVGSHKDSSFTLEGGERPLSIFLTATPNRHDGQGLYPVVDEIVADYDYAYGVREGWLVDVRQMWAKDMLGVTGKEAAETFDADFVTRVIRDHGTNHKTLIFARSVKQSVLVCNTLESELGMPARHVDGTTDKATRKEYIEEFRTGDVKVLSNFGVFREGTDVPGITMIVDNAPTQSMPLNAQKIGRGSRPHPDAKVDSWDTAEERREAIRKSPKPYLVYVPCFEPSEQPFGMVASLLGRDDLEQSLADGGRLIDDVLDKIEEIEASQPERPIRDIKTLDDLEVEVTEVDFWSLNLYDEKIGAITTHQWVFEDNSAGLYLPENPFAESKYEECPVVLHFETQEDGTVNKMLIEQGGWNESLGRPRGKKVKAKGTDKNMAAAIQKVDGWLKRHHPELAATIVRGANGPLREDQIKALKRYGIRHNPDTTTEGTADLLISRHRIQHNLVATENQR